MALESALKKQIMTEYATVENDTGSPEVQVAMLTRRGGWYDRTLALRRAQPAPPWLVGVGFSAQRIDAFSQESWDVPVDALCTERDTLIIGHPQ
jgi:hypothetical protein